MKYMLMFVQASGGWEESAPADELQATYARIGEWWGKHSAAGTIVEGHQLQPSATATTVDPGAGTITDGPFLEAKETIGGYGIVEVSDLDAAIALAKTWPSSNRVEIRPLVVREGM
jgi:hypothetical protein